MECCLYNDIGTDIIRKDCLGRIFWIRVYVFDFPKMCLIWNLFIYHFPNMAIPGNHQSCKIDLWLNVMFCHRFCVDLFFLVNFHFLSLFIRPSHSCSWWIPSISFIHLFLVSHYFIRVFLDMKSHRTRLFFMRINLALMQLYSDTHKNTIKMEVHCVCFIY